MFELHSRSPEATKEMGAKLASLTQAGDVIVLIGDLGTGKTQLTKGIADGLGIELPVISPTFVLLREYRGRLDLFHLDLYRGDEAAYLETGATDLAGYQGVTVIEWGDRIEDLLERSLVDRLTVKILPGARDDQRNLEIDGHGRRSAELARAWVDSCQTDSGSG